MLSLRRHDPCPPALPRADFQNVQIAMMPVRERPHAVQDILALAGTVTDVPSRFSIQMLPVFVTGHLFLGDSQIVSRGFRLAAPQGFEPRYADPESAVLPLNEGAAGWRSHRAQRRIRAGHFDSMCWPGAGQTPAAGGQRPVLSEAVASSRLSVASHWVAPQHPPAPHFPAPLAVSELSAAAMAFG